MGYIERRTKKTGKPSWRVRAVDYRGQEVSRTFDRKGEAEAWMARVEVKTGKGEPVQSSTEPLGDFLRRWLDTAAGMTVRPRTLADYRAQLDKHVIEPLGALTLREIDAGRLSMHYAEMLKGRPGPRTVRLVNSILSRAFRWGVMAGDLVRNPAAELVRAGALPKHEPEERRAMTPKEAGRFLGAARADEGGAVLAFLLLTGCRPSEALALQWPAVDLDAGTVEIRRSVQWPKDGPVFSEPKTRKGRRVLTLAPELVEILRGHRARVNEQRLKLGPAWQGTGDAADLVFPSPIGGVRDLSAVRRRTFRRVCRAAGLVEVVEPARPVERTGTRGPIPKPRPKLRYPFRLYDLRSTFASLLCRGGVPLKTAAALLGHSDPAITARVYAQSSADQEADAVGVVVDLMTAKGGKR